MFEYLSLGHLSCERVGGPGEWRGIREREGSSADGIHDEVPLLQQELTARFGGSYVLTLTGSAHYPPTAADFCVTRFDCPDLVMICLLCILLD